MLQGKSFRHTFRQRILSDKILLLVTAFVTVLSFGFTVTNFSIGLDDVSRSYYLYSGQWGSLIQQGRLIHLLWNWLTDTVDFIPFFNDFLAACLFALAALLYCGLFQYLSERRLSTFSLSAFAAIFISYSLTNEKFIYQLDAVVVMLSYCTGALALVCAAQAVDRRSLPRALGAVGLLMISIASYESFLLLYVCGVFVMFLVRMAVNDEKIGLKKFLLEGLQYAAILIAAAFFYYLLVSVVQRATHQFGVFERDVYLVSSLEQGVFTYLKDATMDLQRLFRHSEHFAVKEFLYLAIGGTLLAVLLSVKKKNALLLFSYLCFLIFNFGIYYIHGKFYYRTCQTFCLTAGFTVFLAVHALGGRKSVRSLLLCGVVLLTLLQAADMNRWFYNDYVRHRKEVFAINRMAEDLMQHDLSKPVVFHGTLETPEVPRGIDYLDTALYPAGNMNGASMVKWASTAFDPVMAPMLREAFRVNGYDFILEPSEEQAVRGHALAKTMPCWPNDGYIQESEDIIVVRIG